MQKNLLLTALVFGLLTSCSSDKLDYQAFKSLQDYSVPLFNQEGSGKHALFIFPHTDDEITCAGTIDQLKQNGWTVSLLTLTKGQAPEEKATRAAEWEKAVDVLRIDNHEIMDLPNNAWENVMRNEIEFWYDNQDSVENIVYRAIGRYQPDIVFTYDTALGGYGHPEHRVTATAVSAVFQRYKGEESFPVQRLMQVTLPEKLEQKLLGTMEPYHNAIKHTGNKTLPEPTLAFDITENWATKRKAASAYTSQAGTMRSFLLLPNEQDTASHYATFDREYYFEVKR